MQHARLCIGRGHIDVVSLQSQTVGDLGNGHVAGAGQDFRQVALVSRVEMLDEHKRHARVGRKMLQQVGKRLQPTGRGAMPTTRSSLWGCSSVRARFAPLGDVLVAFCSAPLWPWLPDDATFFRALEPDAVLAWDEAAFLLAAFVGPGLPDLTDLDFFAAITSSPTCC